MALIRIGLYCACKAIIKSVITFENKSLWFFNTAFRKMLRWDDECVSITTHHSFLLPHHHPIDRHTFILFHLSAFFSSRNICWWFDNIGWLTTLTSLLVLLPINFFIYFSNFQDAVILYYMPASTIKPGFIFVHISLRSFHSFSSNYGCFLHFTAKSFTFRQSRCCVKHRLEIGDFQLWDESEGVNFTFNFKLYLTLFVWLDLPTELFHMKKPAWSKIQSFTLCPKFKAANLKYRCFTHCWDWLNFQLFAVKWRKKPSLLKNEWQHTQDSFQNYVSVKL